MNKIKVLDDPTSCYCPNEVEYIPLKNVTISIKDGSHNPPAHNPNGTVPMISAKNINNGQIDFEDVRFLSECQFMIENKRYNIQKGDVLLTIVGAIGRTAVLDKDMRIAFQRSVCIIKLTDKVNPYFLKYVLESNPIQDRMIAGAKGAAQRGLYLNQVANIRIPVPPLEVQNKIVRKLDSFSSLIERLNSELNAELTARKKQYEFYLDKLLSFEGFASWEKKEIEVKWMKLRDLFPHIRNGFVGTVTPYFTDSENGVRYLEGTNIHDGVISDNEILYVTRDFHKQHIKNELKCDDILMVQSGHIGECAVVGEKYAGSNCHALIIMSNGGLCNSKYVCHYFHTKAGFKQLTPAITGGTIQHVLAKKVQNVIIPVPPIEVQNKIVEILDRLQSLCIDLESGLPAEIDARQKQYEYYRDKLLSFE